MRVLLAPKADADPQSFYNGLTVTATQFESSRVEVAARLHEPTQHVDPRFGFAPDALTFELLSTEAWDAQNLSVLTTLDLEDFEAVPQPLPQAQGPCENCWRILPDSGRLEVVLSSVTNIIVSHNPN